MILINTFQITSWSGCLQNNYANYYGIKFDRVALKKMIVIRKINTLIHFKYSFAVFL